MPIRINLMAEAQMAEELRRKDPVKRAVWICGFVVCLVVLWIAKIQMDILYESSRYNGLEAQWNSERARYSAVTNNLARTGEITRKLSALEVLSTNRFLWGNVLNALQQTVVDQVQVTRISGTQSFSQEESQTIKVGNVKKTLPASVTEKVSLRIDAKDVNPNPTVQNYARYKDKLSNFPYFAKRLGPREGFVMEGLNQVTSELTDTNAVFQSFTLESHFPAVKHDALQ